MTKRKSTDELIVWTYRGPGVMHGIPQRSLTQADFDRLPFTLQQWVRDSSIYTEAAAEKPSPTTDTTTKGGEDA